MADMEEGFGLKEKLAGLFLLMLVVLAVVIMVVIARGKGWFQPQVTYLVKFKQGYNLHQGSLVKMFNTEVGKVTRMRISQQTTEPQVEVTISVVKEYAGLIRQNSVADVAGSGLFGSEYMAISPGTPGYPQIEPYGTIPSSPRKTMAESLAELVNEENLEKLKVTFNNLADLSGRLKTDEKGVATAVANFNQVLVSITQAKGTIGQLVMQKDFLVRLNGTLSRLDRVLADAQGLTGELKPVAQELQTFAKAIAQEAATVRTILANLKRGSQELPGLMETASDTLKSGEEVVEAVKANPLIRLTLPKEPKARPIHVEPRRLP